MLLALALFLLLCAPAYADSFPDVEGEHPHKVAIETLVDQEILSGYESDVGVFWFKPDREVSRAEALKIILLGLDFPLETEASSALEFDDIDADDWFLPYVSTALNAGIVQGYGDNTFKPHKTVSRSEALKMVTLAARIEESQLAVPNEDPFADVGIDDWFSIYALYAQTWNLEPPQTDGLWHPSSPVARDNMAELVYRMQLVQTNGEAFEESTNWLRYAMPDVNASFKLPFGWQHQGEDPALIWLNDEANDQLSALSIYENGGSLLVSRPSNDEGRTQADLFASIMARNVENVFQTTMAGYPVLILSHGDELLFKEWYFYMEGALLHVQAYRGQGDYQPYLEFYMDTLVESLEYIEGGRPSTENILESLNSAIQVDGVGQEMMDLLDDLELIETDAIGVGTGPVDYFYSPSLNITIKYERSFDVILNIEDGETTAF